MRREEEEAEGINFFIPMVDLMVAVLFIFIIIIMVLVLLIREETSAAVQAKHIAIPKIPDFLVVNRSAIEQVVEDITKDALKKNGFDIKLDGQVMRTVVVPPTEGRILPE